MKRDERNDGSNTAPLIDPAPHSGTKHKDAGELLGLFLSPQCSWQELRLLPTNNQQLLAQRAFLFLPGKMAQLFIPVTNLAAVFSATLWTGNHGDSTWVTSP